MSEFDDDEKVISQYSSQTKGALAEMVLIALVWRANYQGSIPWGTTYGFDVTGNRTVSNIVDLSSNLRIRAGIIFKYRKE